MSFTVDQSLRFTSAIRISGGARDIIARDKSRAQKFLAGIQPHGPNAYKSTELRRRGSHHHHAHGHPSHKVVSALSRDATGDTIDATDACLFPVFLWSHGANISAPAMTYTASVGIGSPATDYTLLIDIGSSNTWVGADKKYIKTSTSKDTGKSVVRTVRQRIVGFFSHPGLSPLPMGLEHFLEQSVRIGYLSALDTNPVSQCLTVPQIRIR
jgi:hypothetical protein